ncbi:MAG: hypothetical protein CVU11_12490 [Bacteroidetes bacterium HGW-Bacteroidetes-6]|jgi:hypothetical protein|nr:MAG: hypothetical protein CVU11_12490 [Bacteroidetes bacterium HGW-Bacteroidetes-6]
MTKKSDGLLKGSFITGTHGYLDVSKKRDLWREIADDTNGSFSILHNSSNELETLKIELVYRNEIIKITESATRPLKVEITFDSSLKYNLTVGIEDSIDRILKKLGKKEIEIGYSGFDERYLIQSNDYHTSVNLLAHDIAKEILHLNVYSISYTTNTRANKSELITVISRTVEDKKTIENLIELHKKLIDRLKKMKIINNKG